ncbi:hypothetical protein BDF19DRAFT_419808 [Syncephalis fuscata]|nr:hypothetical protein BDF19DRAFT_419808 [Syncephalis fuscata]
MTHSSPTTEELEQLWRMEEADEVDQEDLDALEALREFEDTMEEEFDQQRRPAKARRLSYNLQSPLCTPHSELPAAAFSSPLKAKTPQPTRFSLLSSQPESSFPLSPLNHELDMDVHGSLPLSSPSLLPSYNNEMNGASMEDELLVMSQSMLLSKPVSLQYGTTTSTNTNDLKKSQVFSDIFNSQNMALFNNDDQEEHGTSQPNDELLYQSEVNTRRNTDITPSWPLDLSQNSMLNSMPNEFVLPVEQYTLDDQYTQQTTDGYSNNNNNNNNEEDNELLQMSQNELHRMAITSLLHLHH